MIMLLQPSVAALTRARGLAAVWAAVYLAAVLLPPAEEQQPSAGQGHCDAPPLSDAERAVLEPPYAYSRPLVGDDGVTVVRCNGLIARLLHGEESSVF